MSMIMECYVYDGKYLPSLRENGRKFVSFEMLSTFSHGFHFFFLKY